MMNINETGARRETQAVGSVGAVYEDSAAREQEKTRVIPSSLRRVTKVACSALFLLSLHAATAGERAGASASTEPFSPDRLFDKGRYEAGLSGGALFSPVIATGGRPTINYSVTSLQLGYMFGDVKHEGFFRGNFEGLAEAFGSGIFQGPGRYIAGGTLWLRYNFVPRSVPRLVPFAQFGAGVVSTDIDRHIVGQPFNFNIDFGLGVRYFATRTWALSLEARLQHISNANLSDRNIGINAFGPILGITHFF